jgi:hypothetical protein
MDYAYMNGECFLILKEVLDEIYKLTMLTSMSLNVLEVVWREWLIGGANWMRKLVNDLTQGI